MVLKQNEQTRGRLLPRLSRPKYGHGPDKTNRNMGFDQTEQTTILVLTRPNKPKYGSLGIKQSKQTKTRLLPRPNNKA